MRRRETLLVVAVAVLVLVMSVPLRRSERMPPMSRTNIFIAAPPATPSQRCFAAVGFSGQPPRKVVDVKPVYPQAARERNVTGTVIVAATIDENGRVIRAEVRRSIEMLDTAALDAAKQWQFAPATLQGTAVCLTMSVAVSFP
jgi:TonB family protein